MVMLKVLWNKTDAKGYTDLIPLRWLMGGKATTCSNGMHEMISQKGRSYPVKCSIVVEGSATILNYGGIHRRQNLERYEVAIGELKISLSKKVNLAINSVQWRTEGQASFEDAPVTASIALDHIYEDDEVFSVEGAAFLASHMRRERDPGLRVRKLRSVLSKQGVLSCEACEFDFEAAYGSIGESTCEVHHRKPLAMTGSREVSLGDLAILCANCHTAIHRIYPLVDVLKFKKKHVLHVSKTKSPR